MVATRSTPPEDKVLEMMEIFQDAFHKSVPDFKRMQSLQQTYDNASNNMTWPTTSKMPIPMMFQAVEKALPEIMDYLFPDSGFMNLVPRDPSVTMDQTRNAEESLYRIAVGSMKLQKQAYRTIKDCHKLSLGYGAIDIVKYTPPASFVKAVMSDGKLIASSPAMGLGEPKTRIRYRYVSPGQIVVTQDGVDFNGDEAVSWAFFLDPYQEDDFNALYEPRSTDGEEFTDMKGNPGEIIAEARGNGFISTVPVIDLIASLAGYTLKGQSVDERVPIQVPVLKCYGPDEHIWIANGTKIIFHQKRKFQTMRRPLVKASAWPDGQRWYPMSSPEAAQKLSWGWNIFVNALFDAMTAIIKPPMVYDKTAFGNKPPEAGPNGHFGAGGPVGTDVMRYMERPNVDAGLFNIGNIIQEAFGSAMGQEAFLDDPRPGLMRAGGMSFETVLQNATGRERMEGAILGSGFVGPTLEQVLMYMQISVEDPGETFRSREWDPINGKEYMRDFTVTPSDLRHEYELMLDLKRKHRNSAIDFNTRMTRYDKLKQDEFIDKYELLQETIEDRELAKRLILSRDTIRERQEEDRKLSVQERELGIQDAQQGNPALPPAGVGEQAMAGAAAMGGGL